jgi:hypothetical protein
MSNHAPIRLAVALTATGLLAGGLLVAPPASAAERMLKVRETVLQTHVDNVGEKGPSLGDRLTFVSRLSSGSARTGAAVGDCTWYSGKSKATAQYYCTEMFRLREGQIAIAGLFSYDRAVNTFAITGGSGRFRDAAGQVVASTVGADAFADAFYFADK